ncbi:diguanylate cyclase [Pseudoalteromonas sp. SSDWG2]|uniref:sensor domain-containing diguanylate cyclase n=1 Tax=Pseudoalteromonas sp. SSDWG2 TaxID=3139391 RepID=UPI003BA8F0BC
MPAADFNMHEIHWLMDMFNTVDVGLVVLDKQYCVCIWNGFMENHSGLLPSAVKDKDIFDLFPSIDEPWFRKKTESAFVLKNRSFTIWEQKPYIFRFKNYRPITGKADHMYQNATFLPLTSTTGEVTHICIIIYDVTDEAVNKLELEAANNQLEVISRTDELTKLPNRRFIEESLAKELKRLERSAGNGTLLILDVDYFKKINDTYGHSAGDKALRHVASVLRSTLRESDMVGRYGGEEFIISLFDTDVDGAKIFAERLRQKIEDTEIVVDGKNITMTISIGMAQYHSNYSQYEQWVKAADAALYEAKQGGRNQVVIAGAC